MSKKLTVKEVRRVRVGQWIRTRWNDVGARDGVLVDQDRDTNGRWSGHIYTPFDSCSYSVDSDQVIGIGDCLEAVDTGL